jgi:uncharacterized membrane protein YfcA
VDTPTVIGLCLLFALGAALYSSVGHGGASAYIAAMALFSVAPDVMRPTALALNLLVAGFGTWRYARRGLSNWKLVLAFALTAMPTAFIGGGIHLPAIYYKPLVGLLLWPPRRDCCGSRKRWPSVRPARPHAGSACPQAQCSDCSPG